MNFPALKKIYFDIGLVLISATLLIFSFSPAANLEFLTWFAFVPLFFCLQNKSKGRVFLLSYLTGIIFWFGTIYWLIHVTFLGLILVVLYLALYFGVFSLIITRYSLLATRYWLLFIPSVWVVLEYLRSHLFTGFGWALLGYSQYLNLPIIQITNITGVWGVSFLVMMINVLIYSVIGKKQKPTFFIAHYVLALVLLSLSLGYGFYKLYRKPLSQANRKPIKISVIQGNIPQAIKWEKAAREKILSEYQRLSRLAAGDSPDLIIWPEAALPGILGQDAYLIEELKTFVNDIRVPLLTGAASLDKDEYYNSAILILKDGEFAPSGFIQRYNKLHLVPFGEYIPLKRIFTFLETVVPIGDFKSGKEYTVFSLKAGGRRQEAGGRRQEAGGRRQEAIRFSVLICFEDIFSGLSRQFVKKEADFLINITNDAWFGNTLSPYQHLSASVFRAVENGVYLVRAANTGISGFITPEGRIYPLIDKVTGKQTFISGYKTKDIFLNFKQNSFYTEWGDWLIFVCLIIAMYGICVAKRREKI